MPQRYRRMDEEEFEEHEKLKQRQSFKKLFDVNADRDAAAAIKADDDIAIGNGDAMVIDAASLGTQ